MARILLNSGQKIDVEEDYNEVVKKFATETMTGHRFATFHRISYDLAATISEGEVKKVRVSESFVEAIFE